MITVNENIGLSKHLGATPTDHVRVWLSVGQMEQNILWYSYVCGSFPTEMENNKVEYKVYLTNGVSPLITTTVTILFT